MPRTRVLALVVALLVVPCVVGCGSSDKPHGLLPAELPDPLPSSRTLPLRERDFRTAVPSGWNSRIARGDGMRTHYLNSGAGQANDFGLAGMGQIGLTIARQRTQDSSAAVALERIVGTPPGAVGVKRTQPATDTTLAGAEAATTQYTYTFDGVTYVQSNLVAVTGGVTVFIEVDASPAQADEAQRTLATVIRNWRWTTREGGVNS
jgi:hypothetical protein